MTADALASASLILAVSLLLVITGIKRVPGIGIVGSLVAIGLTLWQRSAGLDALGLRSPADWGLTILLGMFIGLLIQTLALTLLEPMIERLTHQRPDHSVLDGLRGDWRALLQWLVLVWLVVAFVEEGIYRGFLMTEIVRLVGESTWGVIFNITFTAVVFGLSHWYQGPSGALSTGIVGLILGGLFVWNDYNLWLLIFTHGFIDTVALVLITANADKYIRERLWGTGAA